MGMRDGLPYDQCIVPEERYLTAEIMVWVGGNPTSQPLAKKVMDTHLAYQRERSEETRHKYREALSRLFEQKPWESSPDLQG